MIIHAVKEHLKESNSALIEFDDQVSRFISKSFVINTIISKWILSNPLLHDRIDSMSTNSSIEIDEEIIYMDLIEKIEKV